LTNRYADSAATTLATQRCESICPPLSNARWSRPKRAPPRFASVLGLTSRCGNRMAPPFFANALLDGPSRFGFAKSIRNGAAQSATHRILTHHTPVIETEHELRPNRSATPSQTLPTVVTTIGQSGRFRQLIS